jgi:hypothetical protein
MALPKSHTTIDSKDSPFRRKPGRCVIRTRSFRTFKSALAIGQNVLRISMSSGRTRYDVAAANLIDRDSSGLPHDRSQFATQHFQNSLDTGLAKRS